MAQAPHSAISHTARVALQIRASQDIAGLPDRSTSPA
jgi:hypothetical protein